MKSSLSKAIRFWEKRRILLSIILSATVTVFSAGYIFWSEYKSRGEFAIYFFDVGQGDAALIRAPNGDDVLVDGGPNKKIVSKLGRVLPFYDRTIEIVILTHPHADHLAGLISVLEQYKVERVIISGADHDTALYKKWLNVLKEKGITPEILSAGETIVLGETKMEILAPWEDWRGRKEAKDRVQDGGGLNDASIILKACFKIRCALFMGDASSAIEEGLIAREADLKSDLLKVGHHGSKYSTSEEFLRAVAPQAAVISSGKNNYGHPSPLILNRLKRLGVQIWRADTNGDIVFETNGQNFEIKPQR